MTMCESTDYRQIGGNTNRKSAAGRRKYKHLARGVHARRGRVEGGRDEADWVRFACEPAIDCDAGSRHRRGDREDVEARRGGRPRILRLHFAAGRRGDRSDGLDGMVPPVDGGAGDRVSRGASRGDSEGGGTPAETRSARCSAVAPTARGGSVSDHLDAVDGATRSAGAPVAPSSMGSDAHARAERVARDRDGARRSAGPHVVESRGPGAALVVAACAAYRESPQ